MFDFRSVFSFGANIAPSKKQKCIVEKLESFSKDEDGIATVWAIFWLIICFALSGLAIDVTNAWKVHAILQSTADSSALAGSYELQNPGKTDEFIAGEVKTQADTYATLNMHLSRYGDVLDEDSDIRLGYWYSPLESGIWYSEDSYFDDMAVDDVRGPANAVYVITRQSGTNGTSAVGTFFLRFVGFREFTVATEAIASIFTSQCAYDGLIAENKVIMSTKQEFWGEYCVHGEEGIDLANDNFFDVDTIASTKDEETCGQSDPKCKDSSNPGIENAYMEQTLFGSYLVDINGTPDNPDDDVPVTDPDTGEPILYGKVANIDNYYASLYNNTDEYTAPQPGVDANGNGVIDIGEDINVIEITKDDPFSVLDLEEGMVNIIECPAKGGPDSYNVLLGLVPQDVENEDYPADGHIDLDGIAIVGDQCDFTFDGTVSYANATIITNATGNKTFQGNAGTVLGVNDTPVGNDDVLCNPGGEVTLITMGSVHFASKLEAYDVEIIAAEDVHFAARVDDEIHVGTSVTAGGDIHLTTSHKFIACDGMTGSVFDPIKSWKLVW